MPMWDFQCATCNHLAKDLQVSIANRDQPILCLANATHGPMQRLCSAPTFQISGFNSQNGYSGVRTIRQKHSNGITTQLTGNLEAFDRLHE